MTIERKSDIPKKKRLIKKGQNPGQRSIDEVSRCDRTRKRRLSDAPFIISNNSEDEYAEKVKKEPDVIIPAPITDLTIYEIKRDGSCLFRAVSYLLYGDETHHEILRQRSVKYIDNNWCFFKDFVTEDKYSYIQRKSLSSCFGNHVEISALSYLLNVEIQIYDDNLALMSTINHSSVESCRPIKLCYRNQCHYDAIVDSNNVCSPLKPPSPIEEDLIPCIETPIVDDSKVIEQAYVKSQIQMTEWDDIEQQIFEAVRLQSLYDENNENKKGEKDNAESST